MKPARLVPIVLAIVVIGAALLLFRKHSPHEPENASAQAPERFAWVPHYPGERLQNVRTIQRADGLGFGYRFQVNDDGRKVREFYETTLKSAGFTVIGKGGPAGTSWDLYAENPDRTRSIDVNGNAQPEGVTVGVMAAIR